MDAHPQHTQQNMQQHKKTIVNFRRRTRGPSLKAQRIIQKDLKQRHLTSTIDESQLSSHVQKNEHKQRGFKIRTKQQLIADQDHLAGQIKSRPIKYDFMDRERSSGQIKMRDTLNNRRFSTQPNEQTNLKTISIKNLVPLIKFNRKSHSISLNKYNSVFGDNSSQRKTIDAQKQGQAEMRTAENSFQQSKVDSDRNKYGLNQKQKEQFTINYTKATIDQMNQTSIQANRPQNRIARQIKMKPVKCQKETLIGYLKTLNLPSQTKKNTIFNSTWKDRILNSQCYCSQLTIDGKPIAVVVCFMVPPNIYMIALWAVLPQCTLHDSQILLCKYLQYIQKNTQCSQVLYQGQYMQQLETAKFIKKHQNIYYRARVLPLTKKQRQFQPFLSLKCSNITIPQNNHAVDMFYSQEIQPFEYNASYILPSLLSCDRTQLDQSLAMLARISQDIKDVRALNSILQDEHFDSYEVSPQIKLKDISALRLDLQTAFKMPFVTSQGYFKFTSQELYRSRDSLVCSIQCNKYNTKLYFGKGFTSVVDFMLKTKGKSSKISTFGVRMFSKQLYGRLQEGIVGRAINRGCYGNWEITLSWRDELQGKIQQNMANSDTFGPESFFVGIQIQGQLVYAFEVKQEDFLY